MQRSRAVAFSLMTVSLLVTALAGSGPAWADSPSLILTLDGQFTGVSAGAAPSDLLNCADVPGGAVPDLTGWTFDQPVDGGHPVYFIGFLADVDTNPTPVLIGVDFSGLVRIPLPAGATLSQSQLSSMVVNSAVPGGDEVPAGVEGGLLADGGLWLHTPGDWVLLTGVLRIDTSATSPTSFSLTSVCAPAAAPTGSPTSPAPTSPDASTSVPKSSMSSATPAGTGASLPTTGAAMGALVAIGLAMVLVGIGLAVTARRRRIDDRV